MPTIFVTASRHTGGRQPGGSAVGLDGARGVGGALRGGESLV